MFHLAPCPKHPLQLGQFLEGVVSSLHPPASRLEGGSCRNGIGWCLNYTLKVQRPWKKRSVFTKDYFLSKEFLSSKIGDYYLNSFGLYTYSNRLTQIHSIYSRVAPAPRSVPCPAAANVQQTCRSRIGFAFDFRNFRSSVNEVLPLVVSVYYVFLKWGCFS